MPVSGRWTEGQRETWDLLVAGYRAGLETIRGGVTVEAVRTAFEAAVRWRLSALRTPLAQAAAVILLDRTQSPFWQIHGVGLEPGSFLGPMLRTGMVVALEPMFVVESQGLYLEDVLLVTDEGSELLTPTLPYTAREIEEVMASR